MKVSTQRTPDSQVVLEIEVEPERLDRSLDKAYRRLVQRTEVPGFRKGKAPRSMLERHLGRHRLLHEALDLLIPEVYKEALDQNDIDPIDMPAIQVLQEEPPIFKATVPLRPTVELGDYLNLRLERPSAEVDPVQIDAALEELRHRYALHEPVDRPVQMGDLLRADIHGYVDGRQLFAEEDSEFRLREGAVVLVPGLAEQLVGAEKGVQRQMGLPLPQDYPQRYLAGKPCTFTVLVQEIKQERLPDLDDDFARTVGEGFSNLQALRDRLEADARLRQQAQAEDEYHDQLVNALVQGAQRIEFPPVLVDREIDRLLREEARAAGQDVDRYLELTFGGRDPQDLRQQLHSQAEDRVRRSLALGKLAELEAINVDDKEITEEIERIATSAGPQAEEIRQLFGSASSRQALERSLLTRKTLDRLVAIASGQDMPTPLSESKEDVGATFRPALSQSPERSEGAAEGSPVKEA